MHGFGTMYLSNGEKYEGKWVKGVMQGEGKYSYANNNYYEGEFMNGKK